MPNVPVEGYRLRPAAETDLEDIWDYTAETWGPDQADDYVRGLARTFDLLAEFPEIARERTEIEPPVRCHPYRSHLIIYRQEGAWVVIVRVVHARRHWAGLLEY